MKLTFYNPKTKDSIIIRNLQHNTLWIGKSGGQDDGEGMEIKEQEFVDMLYAWYRERF